MSVKVAVRVRPYNERELKAGNPRCCVAMSGPTTTLTEVQGGPANQQEPRSFTFDYSFWSHDGFALEADGTAVAEEGSTYADQAHVYNALGKQVLDNAWAGYHCCLFAYGQTGSGKSYSMVGYGTNEGIVPQACNEIFRRIQENKDATNKFEVQFSMLEIYNEKVQDLLDKQKSQGAGALKVRENKGEVYVQGLSKHPVDSFAAIATKMDEGYMSRSIGATMMNQTSSRAHTIITIEFKQVRQEEGRKVEKLSVINLVDLAGSEKAGQTGAEGQRLKEGCAINKSLTVLGNCISTLAEKATGKSKNAVVPYRDSNLTRILQNALGGNSKTIMICAISPAALNYEETLGTLRYADRAKKIMNKAVVNESVQDKMIRELKSENDTLKNFLMQAAKDGTGVLDLNNPAFLTKLKDLGLIGDEVLGGDAKALAEHMAEQEKKIEEMEKPWEEKLKEQQERDEQERLKQLENKNKMETRAPHLTNLNEDIQLSGKMYYSLSKCFESPLYIGRIDGQPVPQIILRGVGIQTNHAQIKLLDTHTNNHHFQITVTGKDAWEQTLVNGRRLEPITSNSDQEEFAAVLNHLDRIFIGVNTLFLFKYPLQKFVRDKYAAAIKQEQNGEIDDVLLQMKVQEKLLKEGLTSAPPKSPEDLICSEYPDSQIEEDGKQVDFDKAHEEAKALEDLKKQELIKQQQKERQQEQEQMIAEYQQQMEAMKAAEVAKVQALMQQQQELKDNLLKKEGEVSRITELQEQKSEESRQRVELEQAQKMDKKEIGQLQDQLERVQKQIEAQQLDNQRKIIEQERVHQMKIQEEEEQAMQKKEKILMDYNVNAQGIREANEICKLMGKNIKFKQCIIQQIVDDRGRAMTYLDDDMNRQPSMTSDTKMAEELQVRVQNLDRGTTVMWGESEFIERLQGMRDALAQFEEQKQRVQAKAQAKEDRRLARQKEKEEKLKQKQAEEELAKQSSAEARQQEAEPILDTQLLMPLETEDNQDENSTSAIAEDPDDQHLQDDTIFGDFAEADDDFALQLEQELESDEDSVQSSDREEQKANSENPEGKPEVAAADRSAQPQAEAKQIFAPDAAIEGSQLDGQLDEKQDGGAEAKAQAQRADSSFLPSTANSTMIQEQQQQTMVDEKKAPKDSINDFISAQGGEDKDEALQEQYQMGERTREVSMPDQQYKSLLLDNFLSGIDEFAEEQKSSNPGKSGTTSNNASPTKIPGAKPGMQPWQTIQFEATTEAKTEYIKMVLHKFTSLVQQSEYYTKPIPPEVGVLQCILERDTKGWNKFLPKYTLILEENNKELLSAKKIKSKTAHYRIEIVNSEEKYMMNENSNYLGRLRGSASLHDFQIYDTGVNPEDFKKKGGKLRRQCGTIIYNGDKKGLEVPRKMQGYLPSIDMSSQPFSSTSWPDDANLKKANIGFEYSQQKLRAANAEKKGEDFPNDIKNPQISYLHSKRDNEMDFQGRVSANSRKNIQLIDEFNDKHVYLQFGRIAENRFILDIQYPFSIFQGFAYGLSTFDYKV